MAHHRKSAKTRLSCSMSPRPCCKVSKTIVLSMQKAPGAAIMLGIRQKLIAGIALELTEDCKVLIQLVHSFAQDFMPDHRGPSACRPRVGP